MDWKKAASKSPVRLARRYDPIHRSVELRDGSTGDVITITEYSILFNCITRVEQNDWLPVK